MISFLQSFSEKKINQNKEGKYYKKHSFVIYLQHCDFTINFDIYQIIQVTDSGPTTTNNN
jgi:hypothetical protein